MLSKAVAHSHYQCTPDATKKMFVDATDATRNCQKKIVNNFRKIHNSMVYKHTSHNKVSDNKIQYQEQNYVTLNAKTVKLFLNQQLHIKIITAAYCA